MNEKCQEQYFDRERNTPEVNFKEEDIRKEG